MKLYFYKLNTDERCGKVGIADKLEAIEKLKAELKIINESEE